MRPLTLDEVRPSGWILRQLEENLVGFVGRMPELAPQVAGDVFGAGRLSRLVSIDGEGAPGPWWDGESEGNWLQAQVGHVLLAGTDAQRAELRDRVDQILAAQDADGYLGMFDAELRRSPAIAGELWTLSRVLGALALWGDATGDERAPLAIDRALANASARLERAEADGTAWHPLTGDSLARGHDLMIVDVALTRARETGDRRWVDFAERCYRLFSAAELDWPERDCQWDRLVSAEPFAGHGAHTCENLRIPLLLGEASGDDSRRAAFEVGYAKLTVALGVTGACVSGETIGSPGRMPVPIPEAGYEYCAITELLVTLLEAARVTGEQRYADHAESLVLNAAQAARSAEGRGIGYVFGENQAAATRAMSSRWDVSPTHDDTAVCCSPNAGRILPEYLRHAVLIAADAIHVQFYAAMSVDVPLGDGRVRIVQQTGYPFDEDILLRIDPDGVERFAVRLRIPAWCAAPALDVSGVADLRIDEGAGIRVISGRWSSGAIVRLVLPQPIRVIESIDGRAGLAAGPLVFAVGIPERRTATRTFALEGFADEDVMPQRAEAAYPPVLRRADLAGARLVRADAAAFTDTPWACPPVRIEVGGMDPSPVENAYAGAAPVLLDLVPIGATTLRWTCMSVVDR